jgi:peptidoglycan L-alanyl-D-glutamate endopeptidase CwlK
MRAAFADVRVVHATSKENLMPRKKAAARTAAARAAPATSRAPATAASTGRDTDMNRLHPEVRARVARVLARLAAAGIPFRVFEAFRSPQRQHYLWEQGRVRPGAKVTNAGAWESLHQYGLAVDMVLFENGKWSWDDKGAKARWWTRMQEIGREEGLEPISWEAPHLQLAGAKLAALRAGRYPAGGDASWADNLAQAIYSWSGASAAPPMPEQVVERPPLAAVAAGVVAAAAGARALLPFPGAQGWHSRFGGTEWRYDARGVYLRAHQGGREPLRTAGAPATMRAIWDSFGPAIAEAAQRFGIAPELIMTMIANETAVYRKVGFTGPMTFRWEAHVPVPDVQPPRRGDYSAGPMQVLATTARWIVRTQRLSYDPFAVAPAYERRPEPPVEHPMYDPPTNIELGAAVIKQRWAATGDDPILVAAAYNAGGVYRSADNDWHLRCFGNHLDRTAQWYGDACAVLLEAGARSAARGLSRVARRANLTPARRGQKKSLSRSRERVG